MFIQSGQSLEVAFPGLARVNRMWCVDNPNVDRSEPPPSKKKAVKKKAVKRR